MLISVNDQYEFKFLYGVIFSSLLLLRVAVTVATQLHGILLRAFHFICSLSWETNQILRWVNRT